MMRVLLIEDDAELRNSLRKSLEMEGCESEGAASAEEAIRLISDQPFDLIVTDYNLGAGSNGLFLLSCLKQNGWGGATILMSGYREQRIEDAAREQGVFAFLEKPFPMDLFLEVCAQAVRSGKKPENVLPCARAARALRDT